MSMKIVSFIPLSACIIALLLRKTVFANVTTVNCTSSKSNAKYIECVHLNTKNIPSNFGKHILGITFMYGEIPQLTKNSFMPYPNILVLKFNGTRVKKTSADFLLTMPKLTAFTLFDANFPDVTDFAYPISLEFLTFNGIGLPYLEITTDDFRVLKHLDMNRNNISEFPVLNPKYPIETLVLDNNPFWQLRREHIIPLCSLKYLGCNTLAKKKYQPNETTAICDCLRLQWFLDRAHIRTNFKEQRCTNEETIKKNCTLELDEESVKIRKNCEIQLESQDESKQISSDNKKLWYILGGAVVASVAVVAVSGISINHWRNSRIKTDDSSMNDNEDNTTEAESESFSEEGGEDESSLSEE